MAWALVFPSIFVVALVALYPLFESVRLSFTNARLGSSRAVEYVGFRNYERLFNDSAFTNAMKNTIIFTVSSVALETVLGIAVALVIHSNFKGRGIVRTSMLIPWAIPTVVSAQLWRWMYNDVYGVVNDILVIRLPQLFDWIPGIGDNIAGIFPDKKVAFIADPTWALPSIIAVDVWKTTPFMALLLLAGLQVIPSDVYEASTVDGATKWQQFWQITLPLLRPALLVALIFRTLDAFRVFDVIFVMRGVAPETMSVAVYARQQLIDLQRLGLGSAAAVVIFACIAILVLMYTRLVRIEET
ncbi:MAG: sugar ABC transporter permease [Thermomicrobiales bacterium]|nr:sugar ABC transporter permease [Thermomicrobiales bacterium]